MDFEPFYGRGPQRLLCAGLRVARGKIAISGVPNHLNGCKILILYTQFTDLITERII